MDLIRCGGILILIESKIDFRRHDSLMLIMCRVDGHHYTGPPSWVMVIVRSMKSMVLLRFLTSNLRPSPFTFLLEFSEEEIIRAINTAPLGGENIMTALPMKLWNGII